MLMVEDLSEEDRRIYRLSIYQCVEEGEFKRRSVLHDRFYFENAQIAPCRRCGRLTLNPPDDGLWVCFVCAESLWRAPMGVMKSYPFTDEQYGLIFLDNIAKDLGKGKVWRHRRSEPLPDAIRRSVLRAHNQEKIYLHGPWRFPDLKFCL